ncbi:MAG: thioredoxin domain-containing protein [Pirellulales bacterium]
MANRLARESSPYLLQHAGNPVDWYPWGDEAFERARAEDKPIFLSIGYSACHWCHVMEHESFEDPGLAGFLNEHFISIKVDREERPDLDQIYMQAVQILTGRGGWPMSVFLLPNGEPFYGGTYWPPSGRMGMPGFDQVLGAVLDAWRNRRDVAVQQAQSLTEYITGLTHTDSAAADRPTLELLPAAAGQLERTFDFTFGGFGGAPKFPHPMDLQLLLRCAVRFDKPAYLDMVRLTLDKMAQGGIFDHLGGGFARYSVDRQWLVPHFEKMLYDNAQLATVYVEAYQVTGEAEYREVAEATLDYVLRDLTDAAGGFHSTEDADSEGEEGKFYVWTPAELREVLGPDLAERFAFVYDVTDGGNFEGHSILNRRHTWQQCAAVKGWEVAELQSEMAQARQLLWQARNQRVRPGKDDKILVAWNGLMIHAMARAANAFAGERYLQGAQQAAAFIQRELWNAAEQRLLHTWRQGQAKLNAYLEDYACLINGLISLYEADGDERWIDWSSELADVVLQRFQDREGGGFYFTSDDHERLITRTMDWHDSSVPSGNGMAATALLRLGRLIGSTEYYQAAEQTLIRGRSILSDRSTAAGQLLLAADLWLGPAHEIVAIVDDVAGSAVEFCRTMGSRFLPRAEWAVREAARCADGGSLGPMFQDRRPVDNLPTIYVCSQSTCQPPVSGPDALDQLSKKLSAV